MTLLKINCKFCLEGKCNECIDEDCLCRENHNKQTIFDEATEVMKKHLPNYEQLKQNIKEHPENYLTEKKHKEYASILLNSNKFKTLEDTKEILYYQDGVYVPGGEVLIAVKCERMVKECSTHNVNEITNIIRRETFCKREEFNEDFSRIVLNNGILDLDDMQLNEHDPDFLSTIKLPIDYEPKSRCPKFTRFLKSCLDPHDIITVVEGMANILTLNRKNEEISMMWIGDGSNGKTTTLNIIVGVIGSGNCSHVSIHDMNNDRFAIAQLNGKLVNTYADISNKELNNLGKFKQLVSGDPISAQKKGQDHFELISFAKMFFSANEMPNIIDNSDGAFRRIYVIKWKNQFLPGSGRIDKFDRIILDNEKSGIFNIMLENYKAMQKNGFRYKQNIGEVRELIKKESDKLLEYIQECYVKNPNGCIISDEWYESYQKYCSHKSYEIFSKQKIGANLQNYGFRKGYRKIKGKSHRAWLGYSFNKNSDFMKNTTKGLDKYD